MPKLKNKVYEKLFEKRIIFLNEDIDADVASFISAGLILLDSTAHEPITIYINSFGGLVQEGLFTIYDTMQQCKNIVSTVACGAAYSAAAVILAAGTRGYRFANPNSEIMIHSIQTDISGVSQNQLEKELKRIDRMNDSMLKILSKHTKKSLSKIKKDTVDDCFLSPSEALSYGLIDGIIK